MLAIKMHWSFYKLNDLQSLQFDATTLKTSLCCCYKFELATHLKIITIYGLVVVVVHHPGQTTQCLKAINGRSRKKKAIKTKVYFSTVATSSKCIIDWLGIGHNWKHLVKSCKISAMSTAKSSLCHITNEQKNTSLKFIYSEKATLLLTGTT